MTKEQFEEKLATLDLRPISFTLVYNDDGPRWSSSQCRIVEKWYRRFHTLIHLNEKQIFVPPRLVDIFWHYHILDTQKYWEDCINLHGRLIHHFPYVGTRGPEDRLFLERLTNETRDLFVETFGENPETIREHFKLDGDCEEATVCGAGCAQAIRPEILGARPSL
jgi:hypothetical protein